MPWRTANTIGKRVVPSLSSAGGVWRLGEVEEARRENLWPVANDPFFSEVVLLLEDSLTDLSSRSQTATAFGGAAFSNSEAKVGTSSLALALGDRVQFDAGADFVYGTGDFTFECWFYQTATSAFGGHLWSQTQVGYNYLSIRAGAASPMQTKIDIRIDNATLVSSGEYSLNAWHHVAVVRDAGVVTIYLDGQPDSSATMATSLDNDTYAPTIGTFSHDASAARFAGYIDSLRLTNGVARYSGAFTPPNTPHQTF